MQITININPTEDNTDEYYWGVEVEGEPAATHSGRDFQDVAAIKISQAVIELVRNAEVY